LKIVGLMLLLWRPRT